MIFNQINHFDDEEHETLMGVWWAGTLLKQKARRFFKKHPVSDSQFNALMILKYAETPLTQQDLSGRLLVDKSNVTSLVDGLEKLGFVIREKVPGDRRFYRLTITQEGLDFLDIVELDYRNLIHRLMSVFSAEEMKQLTEYMVRLQTGLEQEE